MPYYSTSDGVLTQTNDRLEVTGTVTPGQTDETVAAMRSKAVGSQVADWEVKLDVYIGDFIDFWGITDNDIVAGTLSIDTPGAGDDDFAEMNFGFANSGSGFDHVVRFGSETNGTSQETLVWLDNSDGVERTLKLSFTASDKVIRGYYYDPDTNSFVEVGSVDTSSWGMGPGDVFMIELAGSGLRWDEGSNFGDYTIDSGEFYFDNFNANGDGISLIPEPLSAGLLLAAGAVLNALGRKRRRR